MAKTKKKNYTLVLLFVLLIGISVGYAAFAQTLTITGTATANGNFKLEFSNAQVTESTGVKNASAIVSDTKDNLNISMDLDYPGAGATIKATITNTGSIASKLNDIEFTGIKDSDILVSFDTDAIDTVIDPGKTSEVVITVKWNNDSTTAKSLNFTAALNYVQSTESFVPATNPESEPQS